MPGLLPEERELPAEGVLPDERLMPGLLPDERELPEERVIPELPLEERELPAEGALPDERLMPELPPDEREIPEEPEARDEPELPEAFEPPELPLEPRVTRWASTLATGAAKHTTASTANNEKKSFLGVNMADLRPTGQGQRKKPRRQCIA